MKGLMIWFFVVMFVFTANPVFLVLLLLCLWFD